MSGFGYMVQITSMLKFKFFKDRLNGISNASSEVEINSLAR